MLGHVIPCKSVGHWRHSTFQMINVWSVCIMKWTAVWTGVLHDDVLTWKCFLHYWPFVRWTPQSLVDSPHKWPIMRSFNVFFDIKMKSQLIFYIYMPMCLWVASQTPCKTWLKSSGTKLQQSTISKHVHISWNLLCILPHWPLLKMTIFL